METCVYNSKDEHILSSMGSKTLDKQTQPILGTHMGTYLIQSDWNTAASYVFSCSRSSWESASQYQLGFEWQSLYNYKNVSVKL